MNDRNVAGVSRWEIVGDAIELHLSDDSFFAFNALDVVSVTSEPYSISSKTHLQFRQGVQMSIVGIDGQALWGVIRSHREETGARVYVVSVWCFEGTDRYLHRVIVPARSATDAAQVYCGVTSRNPSVIVDAEPFNARDVSHHALPVLTP